MKHQLSRQKKKKKDRNDAACACTVWCSHDPSALDKGSTCSYSVASIRRHCIKATCVVCGVSVCV